MEGVMMRNGGVYALAVRLPDGNIIARRLPWFSMTCRHLLKKPFLRGFPILLETLVNGIHALNLSAESAAQAEDTRLTTLQLALTIALALIMAVGLFVVAPHLLSLLMLWLHLGGDVEGVSFHLWDGFFKCAIFMAYIKLISCMSDIRRVFQYHGAEHKSIHAYEAVGEVNVTQAAQQSRLHPRCGTTFLLFVICLSILLHTLLVPLLLVLVSPQNIWLKHCLTVVFKLLLVIPISAIAYELIRYAARLPEGMQAAVLRTPGLTLQKLTTYEPDMRQLDVALVALREALGPEAGENIHTAPYSTLR
ncbi:lipoprotein [Deltaproteobacteria bacterium]|nr:lipoprotein [Deltaproteobacteria bacterium]